MLRRRKQNTGFKPGQRVQRPEAPDPEEEPAATIDRSPRRGAGGGINDIFSSGQTRVKVGRAKKSTRSFFEPEITEAPASIPEHDTRAEEQARVDAAQRAAAEQARADAEREAQEAQEAAEQAQREAEELAAAQARLRAAQEAEAVAKAAAAAKATESASTEDELASLEARPFASLSNDEKTRLIMLRRQGQNTGFKPGYRAQRPEAPDPDDEPPPPLDRSPRRGGGSGINDIFGAGQTRVRLARPKKKTD
jgi:chemotaxis protein histidine kinase CheA